jgi:hypothetical protein
MHKPGSLNRKSLSQSSGSVSETINNDGAKKASSKTGRRRSHSIFGATADPPRLH